MIYIEIIIATAFILFLLSSLVSGINELWAMLLNKRGRQLQKALHQAFPELGDELMRSLYNHPLIAPTKEKPKGDSLRGGALKVINYFRVNKYHQDFLPSYIDSKLFARALADILVLGKDYNDAGASYGDELRQLYTAVESLDRNNFRIFKDMYLSSPLADPKSADIWQKLKDASKGDFVQGKSDILRELREEMSDRTKLKPEQRREALLTRSLIHSGTEQPTTTDFLARHSKDMDSWTDITSKWFEGYMDRVSGWYKKRSHTNLFWWSLLLVVIYNISLFDIVPALYEDHGLREVWVQQAVDFEGSEQAKEDIEKSMDDLKKWLKPYSFKEIRSWLLAPGKWSWSDFKVLPGWLITALAISLGAPFWFDVLSRAVNLRAAGKKSNNEDPKTTS